MKACEKGDSHHSRRGDFFLKSCFWHFLSEYNSSSGSHQFWRENRGVLGRQFPA